MNCAKFCFAPLLLASVILLSSISWSEPGNPLEITIQNQLLQVTDNSQPLLTYKYSGVPYKPYVQKLFTPNGKNILRDAPHDHLHHHALMFAVSLNDVSFWEEAEDPGTQEHQSFQQVNLENGSAATFEESLAWKHTASNTFANESRTISVRLVPKYKATLLEWQTTLTPTNQPIKVGGSHYYGLGMRFLESMDKIGTFINSENSEGTIFRGEERLTDANWCAYAVNADFPVTVCMMNDPANRKPSTWFTMPEPFSYLSATLRYHEKPFEITKNSPLKLQYAVALWDEILTRNQIDAFYQAWSNSK